MKTFLTGSSRGIGKAITLLFLKNNIQVIGTSKKTNFETPKPNPCKNCTVFQVI